MEVGKQQQVVKVVSGFLALPGSKVSHSARDLLHIFVPRIITCKLKSSDHYSRVYTKSPSGQVDKIPR